MSVETMETEPMEPAAERAVLGPMVGAPAVDLIAYGRILAAQHPYGSQERELLTALAEALAARQPVEILAQMGRLQAKERASRERAQILEAALVTRGLTGRLIESADELAHSTDRTIVLDAAGAERHYVGLGTWYAIGGTFPRERRALTAWQVPLPAVVIYEPTALAVTGSAS